MFVFRPVPDCHRRTRPSGQAIAEFAISVPVILLLLLAILQFALLYNAQIGVTNGVRDTARYGSQLIANTPGSAATAATLTYNFLSTSLGTYVTPYSPSSLGSGSQACFVPFTDASSQPAVRVRVTAVFKHPLIVPLISNILDGFDGTSDGAFAMTSVLEMRVDNPSDPVPALSGAACS